MPELKSVVHVFAQRFEKKTFERRSVLEPEVWRVREKLIREIERLDLKQIFVVVCGCLFPIQYPGTGNSDGEDFFVTQ